MIEGLRPGPSPDETSEQRADRIKGIIELVKTGRYHIDPSQLAEALLHKGGKQRSNPQAYESLLRRRAYMKSYMRKRRALELSHLRGGILD